MTQPITSAETLDVITCPHCGRDIHLGEAVTRGLRAKLQAELEAPALERERKLAEREAALKRAAETQEDEVRKRLEKERAELLEKARREARDGSDKQLRDLQSQIEEQKKKAKEAEDAELELRKQARELEEKAGKAEIELQRRLDEERAKIKEGAQKDAEDQQRLRLAEKDKIIEDMKTKLDEAQKKASQVSQQLQGEVLEMEIERVLRESFPQDEIAEVKAGARGADVTQGVRSPTGQPCGTIYWESKRTQNYQPAWLAKLREDQRETKADIAVLVSEQLPEAVKEFGSIDGVWLCRPRHVAPLAMALRAGLIETALARRAQEGVTDKMAILYQYLTGNEFRLRVQAIVEAFEEMRSDLAAERRAIEKQWAKREKQLATVIQTTARMYGDLQGLAGAQALPDIEALALEGGRTAES